MRWTLPFLIAAMLAIPAVQAQEPASTATRREAWPADTVRAARAMAVSALYEQAATLPLSPRVTVADFLEAVDGREDFMRSLEQADQIGAPRWTDANTCQVQLQIPASRVAQPLRRLASAYPKRTHVTVEQIDRAVADWPRRVFDVTGVSASATALQEFKPAMGERWEHVSDAARHRALQAANTDAARRVLDSVSAVKISEKATLGDGLAVREVGEPVLGWLRERPVTNVVFRDDLQVEVTLAVNRRDFFSVVRTALERQRKVPLPPEPEAWTRIERDFEPCVPLAVGRASALGEQAPVTAQVLPEVPRHAPDWVNQQIEVEGTAPAAAVRSSSAQTKLRTAAAARADARRKLQGRLEALQLANDLSVGQAAQRDPHVTDAITQAIQQAEVTREEFRSDGSAAVKLTLDLRDFWDELSRR